MKVYKIDIAPISLFKELPSSYTIFGAICWGYLLLYGEEKLNRLINQFVEGNIPFLLSSIFPRKGKSYFFPKPNLKAIREENGEIDYKKLKRIKYIDIETLKKVLNGQIKTESELHKEINNKSLSEISVAQGDSIPHASIDRFSSTTSGEGGLYFEDAVAVNESFFLIAIIDNEIMRSLKAVFNLLQDIGIGGNRSIGYGRVVFGDIEPFPELEKYIKDQTNKFITIAPIIPEENTYKLSDSYWDYFTFQGAIDNNYAFKNVDIWKEKVFYIKEGSVMTVSDPKSFYGSFYPAKEINGRKIYQYGLAFPLFIQED
ncbi:type III-A CRISPR-associated RAMP protein Csm4 [Persephonella sp.]